MRYFLDRNVTVRRTRKTGNYTAFSATGTAYECSLQDMQPDKVQMYGGEIGKMYDIYVPDTNTNISAGDQVVIAGVKYGIKGKQVIDFGGVQYIQLAGVKLDG